MIYFTQDGLNIGLIRPKSSYLSKEAADHYQAAGQSDAEELTMTKETDSYSYEITLRVVGQALEALGVESFELVLDAAKPAGR